jgi:hypothetical protein
MSGSQPILPVSDGGTFDVDPKKVEEEDDDDDGPEASGINVQAGGVGDLDVPDDGPEASGINVQAGSVDFSGIDVPEDDGGNDGGNDGGVISNAIGGGVTGDKDTSVLDTGVSGDEDTNAVDQIAEQTGVSDLKEREDFQSIAYRYEQSEGNESVGGHLRRLDLAARGASEFVLDNPNASVQENAQGFLETVSGQDAEEIAEGAQADATAYKEATSGALEGTALDNPVTDAVVGAGDALVAEPAKAAVTGATGIDIDEGTTEGEVGAADAFDIGVTIGTAGAGRAGLAAGSAAAKNADEGATVVNRLLGGSDEAGQVAGSGGSTSAGRTLDDAGEAVDDAGRTLDDSRLRADGGPETVGTGPNAPTRTEVSDFTSRYVDDSVTGGDEAATVADDATGATDSQVADAIAGVGDEAATGADETATLADDAAGATDEQVEEAIPATDELLGDSEDVFRLGDEAAAGADETAQVSDEAVAGSDEAATLADDAAGATDEAAQFTDETAAGADETATLADDAAGATDEVAQVTDEAAAGADDSGGVLDTLFGSRRRTAATVGGTTAAALGGGALLEALGTFDTLTVTDPQTGQEYQLIKEKTYPRTENRPNGGVLWQVTTGGGSSQGYTAMLRVQGRNVYILAPNGEETRAQVSKEVFQEAISRARNGRTN